jgi:hypothetical protein
MTKAILVALTLSLFASGAMAQERATDAAIGAVSGAVVLGPIGAVAGALIGYTAGPAISRSWGVRGSNSSARQGQRQRHAKPGQRANGRAGTAGSAKACLQCTARTGPGVSRADARDARPRASFEESRRKSRRARAEASAAECSDRPANDPRTLRPAAYSYRPAGPARAALFPSPQPECPKPDAAVAQWSQR